MINYFKTLFRVQKEINSLATLDRKIETDLLDLTSRVQRLDKEARQLLAECKADKSL